MPAWDSPDLLARVKRYAKRPSVDEAFDNGDWYALLTEAEQKWKPILAVHMPGPMYNAPQQLTKVGDGETYTFPDETDPPLAIELYTGPNGNVLTPGAYHDPNADYVWEGTRIRMVRGRARTFSDGPYGRWVSAPGEIDEETDSTIQPAKNRVLLVFDALERWASIGGYMDPLHWTKQLQKALYGDPAVPGDIGILGDKAQDYAAGMAAIAQGGPYRWWRPGDNGSP